MAEDPPAMQISGSLLDIARKEYSGAPMETLGETQVSTESGISGDYRGDSKRRQVTVLAREDWEQACAELNTQLPWTTRRANLLVEGVSLTGAEGKTLWVGDLALEITGETKPCDLMDRSYNGLRARLVPDWRGGVTCKVVQGATIKVGDTVRLEG